MTRAAARAPRLAYAPEPDREPTQAEAGIALAMALDRLAGAIEDLKPAADGIHSLGVAQTKFCNFLVKHRLKLALSIPSILVAIGAISPNAAHSVAVILKSLGAA